MVCVTYTPGYPSSAPRRSRYSRLPLYPPSPQLSLTPGSLTMDTLAKVHHYLSSDLSNLLACHQCLRCSPDPGRRLRHPRGTTHRQVASLCSSPRPTDSTSSCLTHTQPPELVEFDCRVQLI